MPAAAGPRWLAAVCAGVLSASVTSVATLVLIGTVPLLWGWNSYTVVSGSMQPLLRRGDVVVVAPSDGRDLPVGTVVVVTPDPTARPDAAGSTAQTITHRIVERLPDGRYRTKGDANPVQDSRVVAPDAVAGTLRIAVPLLGWPMLATSSGPVAGLPILGVSAGIGMLVAGAGLTVTRRVTRRPPRQGRSTNRTRNKNKARARLVIVVALATGLTVAGRVPTAAVMTGRTSTASNSYATRSAFYAQSVITSGPVSYWRLGESAGTTTLADQMGTVPLTRGSSVTTGEAGAVNKDGNTAMRFPEVSSSAGIATTGATPPSALAVGGPLTVAAWFRTSTPQTTQNRLVTKFNGMTGPGNINYFLAFNTTGTQMRFLIDTANQRTTVVSPSTGYNDNVWHFAVGVYDGINVMLYLDGQQVASSPLAGTAPLHTAAADPVTISYNSSPLKSVAVDEVAIWSKALSASQISTLYSVATT